MPLNLRIIIPLILIGIAAYLSVFTVKQWEQALVFKFREIVRSDDQPGLHFMVPIVNAAKKFEKRLLNLARTTLSVEYQKEFIEVKLK